MYYSTRFAELRARLHSIDKLEDLNRIRRSLLESATDLQAIVDRVGEDLDHSLAQLRTEIDSYRAKLAVLEKSQIVDALTGLANRREVEIQIEERVSSAKSVFCLAIIDLNGFKGINDIHGHVAGDDLLKLFAARVKARVRLNDVVGRWGGDEFIIVVDSGLEEARNRVARIRKGIVGDYDVNTGISTVTVSLNASVGIAEWNRKESAVELLARADRLMYAEKKLGDMETRPMPPAQARSARSSSQTATRRPVQYSTAAAARTA